MSNYISTFIKIYFNDYQKYNIFESDEESFRMKRGTDYNEILLTPVCFIP